jgi:hypothetical protein
MKKLFNFKITRYLFATFALAIGAILFPPHVSAEHGTINYEVHLIVDGAVIKLPGMPVVMDNIYITYTNKKYNLQNASKAGALAVSLPDGHGYFTTTGNSLAPNCSSSMAYISPGGYWDNGGQFDNFWGANCSAPGIIIGGNPSGLPYVSGAGDNFCSQSTQKFMNSPIGGYTCGVPCVHGSISQAGDTSRHTKFFPYFPKNYFSYYRSQGIIPLGVQYDANDIKGGGKFSIASLGGDNLNGQGRWEYGNTNISVPTINYSTNTATYKGNGTAAGSEWVYISAAINGGSKSVIFDWTPIAINAVCGDGNVDPGEECDPPGSACGTGGTCNNSCACDLISTPTPTPTPTPTVTPTPTLTPTPTGTPTPTPTGTLTPTPSPTVTVTPTPTSTPVPGEVSVEKSGTVSCGCSNQISSATLTYTIRVTGDSLATRIVNVVDTFDSKVNTSSISAISPAGAVVSNGTITWSGVSIPQGQVVTFTYKVAVSQSAFGNYINSVTITEGSTTLDTAQATINASCIPCTAILGDFWDRFLVGALMIILGGLSLRLGLFDFLEEKLFRSDAGYAISGLFRGGKEKMVKNRKEKLEENLLKKHVNKHKSKK